MPDSPATIGAYEVLAEVGRGGMGIVYHAVDPRLQRHVAIKVLPPSVTTSPNALSRFRQEAKLLAAVNHRNIATIHSLEEADGRTFLTMELLTGETLADRLARGPLELDEALSVLRQVASALDAAHRSRVIHRDLKPANVVFSKDGEVKVLDFGLARTVGTQGEEDVGGGAGGASDGNLNVAPNAGPDAEPGAHSNADSGRDSADETLALDSMATLGTRSDSVADSQSGRGPIVGTPGYMSPEQIHGRRVDGRTDLFSFGCVAFECLAGGRLFAGNDVHEIWQQTMRGDIDDVSVLGVETPDELVELIGRCVDTSVEKRPGSATEVRRVIEAILDQRRVDALLRSRTTEVRPAKAAHNLPRSLNVFAGRSKELHELHTRLVESRVPLMTVTGVGGGGKSRLVREVVGRALDHFDRVWFVPLVGVDSPELLPQTVLSTLGLKETPGQGPEDVVVGEIGDSQTLFILDNCEHLADAASLWATQLLSRCPRAQIVATSRQPLRAEGEQVYPLAPLSLKRKPGGKDVLSHHGSDSAGASGEGSDSDDGTGADSGLRSGSGSDSGSRPGPGSGSGSCSGLDPSAASASDGAQLFLARAREADPSWSPTATEHILVEELCARLDGLPLAIELAASRIRSLDLADLASRLEDRFRLLRSRSSGSVPHHQTLASLFEWSFRQLSPEEQTLLGRLSVFRGGWTTVAAEEVTAAGRIEEWEVLDLLAELVDKSMVVREFAGSSGKRARYRLLESVREFCAMKLEASGARDEFEAKHRRHFAKLAKSRESDTETEWMATCAAEHENLWQALDASRAVDDVVTGLEVVAALIHYWDTRGHWSEGLVACGRILDHPSAARHDALYAKVHLGAAVLSRRLNDIETASGHLETALERGRATANRRIESEALNGLGLLEWRRGHVESARSLYKQSLEAAENAGARDRVASALQNLALLHAVQGKHAEHLEAVQRVLALRRELGDLRGESAALVGVSMALSHLNRLEEAMAQLSLALEIDERLGDRLAHAGSLTNMGELLRRSGEPENARKTLDASIAAHREIRSSTGEAFALNLRAAVHDELEDEDQAMADARLCLELCERHSIVPLVGEPLRMLSQLAERRGDWETVVRLEARIALHFDAIGRIDAAKAAVRRVYVAMRELGWEGGEAVARYLDSSGSDDRDEEQELPREILRRLSGEASRGLAGLDGSAET